METTQEQPTIHYGLDVAEYIAHVDPNAQRIDVAIMWARGMIDAWGIKINTPNYNVLLAAPEHFGIEHASDRQRYFRTIFLACLNQQVSPAEQEAL